MFAPLCLAILASSATVLDDFAEEHQRLIGAWKGPKGELLGFEAQRLVRFQEGRQSFERARYVEDRVDSRGWRGVQSVWFEFTDEGLELCHEEFGDPVLYTRLEEIPDELQLRPLEFGEADPSEEELAALKEEFAERHIRDQAVRKPPITADRHTEMVKVDRENTARVRELVARYGWIDAARFGVETTHTAFLIVQHSGDLALMSAALPAIEKEVKAGVVAGQNYALLYDRLQLNLGGLQRYGSQLAGSPEGTMLLMPCEDLEKLDEQRASVGLGPIEDYLKLFDEDSESIRRLGPDDWD